MLEKGNYKIGFDIWALILFLLIMIPNFIWFVTPAPNDILRSESITPTLDTVASIFQVIMVISLSIIINTEGKKPIIKGGLVGITVSTLIYFCGWILYYQGIVNTLIVLILCITPCLSFILFSIGRKNIIAIISSIIFMLCHTMYGFINYIV